MGSTRIQPAGIGFGGVGMTPVVKGLLIVNTALFVLGSLFRIDLAVFFGLMPYLLVKGMVWQIVTYMFLHGSLGHILFNMLALWMFGTVLERTWGSQRFLRYYMVCGIGAGLCVVLGAWMFGDPRAITIGASGAIYGVMVAFGVLFPNATILAFLFFPMPARYFVILMGGISFYLALQSGPGSTVSHIAHLGGFVVGYLYLKRMESSGGYSPITGYYSHRPRRSAWTKWFSVEEWRIAYATWRRKRLKKQFEVYMRKQDRPSGPDNWVN